MVFGRGSKSKYHEIDVKIEGTSLKVVQETTFLGIIVDNTLTWKAHAAHICKKISKSLGILYRARKILGQDTLRQLYFSFLYPYLSYCITIWGNAPASTLYPIFKLQKRAVIIVYNIKYRDSTKMACKKAKLLRLPELYTFSILIFMYKFTNNLLQEICNTFYAEKLSLHNYPTRQANNLRNPKV